MTSRPPVLERHGRGLAAVAALAVLTACSASTDQPAAERPAITVDEDLRELLPDDVREAGVVTVATDPSYPPASSFGPDGRTIVGFEPDLAAALGDVLGLDVELRSWDFDQMLTGLGEHEFDLVISSMTDTVERQAQADFVNYFQAGTSVVVQRGNPNGIHDLTDLCGRLVAVEAGTVQVDLIERSQSRCGTEPIQLSTHPTNDDALLELRTGRVAAVLNDYPPAVYVTTDERSATAFQLMSALAACTA